MTKITNARIFLLLMFIAFASSLDVTSAMMRRMELMEAKIVDMEARHQAEIKAINQKVDQQRMEILDLKKRNGVKDVECIHKISEIEERMTSIEEKHEYNGKFHTPPRTISDTHDASITRGDARVDNLTEKVRVMSTQTNQISEKIKAPETNEGKLSRRALADGTQVAFSAYIDHNADGMGPGQTLIYNQVLLNDGNAYNHHSGIFTVPIPGVYSFSFFIGERSNQEERVQLTVNSDNKMDAVAQSNHATDDTQGGNVANLKLNQGDLVYVKNIWNGHVEGGNGNRHTSFSGFLIYPVETLAIVV